MRSAFLFSASAVILISDLVFAFAGSTPPLQFLLEELLSIVSLNAHEISAISMWCIFLLLFVLSAVYLGQTIVSMIKGCVILGPLLVIVIVACFLELYFGYGYLVETNTEASRNTVAKFLSNPKSYHVTYDDASLAHKIEFSYLSENNVYLQYRFPMMGMYDFRIEDPPLTPIVIQVNWYANRPRLFVFREKSANEAR